jgi:serine protease AprX
VLGLPGPYDDCGHGTHVAGIIAGSGAGSAPATGSQIVFRGAAPGASLVALKVLDAAGSSSTGRVMGAIDWCLTNRQRYNLRVMNLSLGCPVKESSRTDPLCMACHAAVRAGMVVVVAAGNKGKNSRGTPVWGGITTPANEPSVLTVGASNTLQTPSGADDVMTRYSSRGPTYIDNGAKPDLVAPGNKIVSVRAPLSRRPGHVRGEVPPQRAVVTFVGRRHSERGRSISWKRSEPGRSTERVSRRST